MEIDVLKQLAGLITEEMGAPDYNPAKASAGGPGYASMPQQVKLAAGTRPRLTCGGSPTALLARAAALRGMR